MLFVTGYKASKSNRGVIGR